MSTPSHATDRGGLEVLPSDECLQLLASQPVGRVAFIDAGEPVVLPVNHRVDGWAIVFRTDLGGKLRTALLQRPVAFEVDAYDTEARTGWSVLVRGVADIVDDHDTVRRLDELGLSPWATGHDRPYWIRIRPEEISGRRITRPRSM